MANKSQNKTQPTKVSIGEFLATVKNAQRRKDAEALIRLMRDISGEPAVMWGPSIIGFGSCHYKYESGREGDMPMICFSPRSTSLVIYVVDATTECAELLKKLGPHTTGKVCLYVKRLDDIDLNVLKKLIQRSYQHALSHKDNVPKIE